ncbi:hypothetical protein LEP1GSC123_1675 [Leptospira borgpetersenii str. 200701203]|uniref:Uncharacterized protein n=1 Tax=Leptospira borgpetersenii str. 200701203 TaxID=1193007 RepID=M3GU23_LEPBO|nr:hypothetical protein LEP1GSC123_1675 [Leptospira borgpetersenii str. 200701203]
MKILFRMMITISMAAQMDCATILMLGEAQILPTRVWSMARYADKTVSPELSKNLSALDPPLWIYPGTRFYWIAGIGTNFPLVLSIFLCPSWWIQSYFLLQFR